MRHGKVGRKLKRTASHRKATLGSLSTSLLRHKKIQTTTAKAKETRRVVERVITRAKRAIEREAKSGAKDIHARREVAKFIHDRAVVKELFGEIAKKVQDRPGGYSRVVKLGRRHGDGAEVAVIELVDYNVGREAGKGGRKSKRTEQKEARPEPRPAEPQAAAAPAEPPAVAEPTSKQASS